jgi:hypothetical protein
MAADHAQAEHRAAQGFLAAHGPTSLSGRWP